KKNHYKQEAIDTIMSNISIDNEKIIFKVSKNEINKKISSDAVINSIKNNLQIFTFYNKAKKGCTVIYYHDFLETPLKTNSAEYRGVDSSSCK
ncbi:MAG TPA: hypothetical protein VK835_14075, partial [Bacteroidia bacterium]|nr:hypothetical protein [Bacteroidia bacterium]